ncbi:MAG: translesion DNA synthesis-associated protein ImuA [Gammaproteobacteria bacterium]|nr:translesion DNA synthesis-associated protein ImuA [Gammaproteobacteria bacterium]
MNLDLLLNDPTPWRDTASIAPPTGLSTGFPELDALLPNGGWPRGAVTELLVPQEGVGALQLLLPALAKISQQRRWIAWVAPPYVPYAPALAAAGVDLSRVLLIHPRVGGDGLATVERSLRSGTCGAVLAWPMAGDGPALRRLQLAAAEGDAWGVLFRPEQFAGQSSPIGLRLQIARRPTGVDVSLLKQRGGRDTGPVSFSMDRLLQQQATQKYLS